MAEASDFEGRVRALLDRGRNRTPLTRRAALTVAAIACALILPIATITSHAQASSGALVGVVNDPSGARIPGAAVMAKNLDSANEETTIANAAGEFGFRAIAPGRYEIQVRAQGFKAGRKETVVTAGTVARADTFLEIGQISESVTVIGRKPAVPAAAPMSAAMPQRIPIGGYVQASRLLAQVRPEYPPELQQQGVAGTVMLRGVVGKDGQLLRPQVINTDIHPGLAKAALDAVRKWLYKPTRLNGEPVETLTNIDIHFELDK